MNKKITYDKKNDILVIHKGFSNDERFKGNIDAGDLILDVSSKERIRGIEIMNAAQFLGNLKITKKMLENISDAEFNANVKSSGIIIGLVLKSKNVPEVATKIAVPI